MTPREHALYVQRKRLAAERWLEYLAKLQPALMAVLAAAEKRQAERKAR